MVNGERRTNDLVSPCHPDTLRNDVRLRYWRRRGTRGCRSDGRCRWRPWRRAASKILPQVFELARDRVEAELGKEGCGRHVPRLVEGGHVARALPGDRHV